MIIAIKQQKLIKGIQIGKKEIKLPLLADDMIVYVSYTKNLTRELLQLIITFSDVAGYKIRYRKISTLLCTNDKEADGEIREI